MTLPSGKSIFLVIARFAGLWLVIRITNSFAANPEPWQIGLQPAAGSIAEKATSLHNLLLIIITAISLFVLALLVYVCLRFRESQIQ